MCIVIDVNTIPSVLNEEASDHQDYKPVLDWVRSGKAKIVYGGAKYKSELAKLGRYLHKLAGMKLAGQVEELDDSAADSEQARIGSIIQHSRFNDQAIVAIVIVSQCKFVCSADERSFPFLKNKRLYSKNVKRPTIYTGLNQAPLLTKRHVLRHCGPCGTH